MDERKVKRIYHPPTVPAADLFKGGKQRRIAAYARVSTASDEQLNSVEAQKDYFAKLIRQRPDWVFVDVYADEGITGTSINRREAFNRMVTDALAGNIDLIVTKSISRFARNTVDTLNTIRQLKAANVEVFFEKENIYTMDSKGEFLITLLSSIAEEESRSISENVKWGQRKRFADGKYSVPYTHFLGYRKGAEGNMEIVPEEAGVVRWIYHMFLKGIAPTAIATILTTATIPSPAGGDQWWPKTVMSILTNEKYYGAARLQKTYTVDFLTKTKKVNKGEVPQYYVECSHPAIIDPAEWEAVQVEVARRKKLGRRHDCFTPFSGKVICGDCGGVYGSKIWHSNSKYRRVIWQCNRKFKNETKCTTPHVDEEILKERFLQAVSEYMADPEERIESLRSVQRTMSCTDFIDADIEEKEAELELLSGMIRNCVMMKASASLTEQEYQAQYTELSQRYESTKAGYETLLNRRKQMEATAITFSGILFRLAELPHIPMEFNETLWHTLVDHVTIYNDERIAFTFTDGTEIVTML